MPTPDIDSLVAQLSAARKSGQKINVTLGGKALPNATKHSGFDPAILKAFQPGKAGGFVDKAPETYNLGESLLNLLNIGSTISSGTVSHILDKEEAKDRIAAGLGTNEDIKRVNQSPLEELLGNVAAPFEGPVKTIGNLFGAVPSSELPTGPKEFARTQDLAASRGLIKDSQKLNDVGVAATGIAGDILLDPTTYVTLGIGGLVKGAAQGAMKAGSIGGKALVRPAQALKTGATVGSSLGRDVTGLDRLAGAGEGAVSGFKKEAGKVPLLDLIKNGRARSAARKAGVEDYTEGLAASNVGGASMKERAADLAAAETVTKALGERAGAVDDIAEQATKANEDADPLTQMLSDSVDESADPALKGSPADVLDDMEEAAQLTPKPKGKKGDLFGTYSGEEALTAHQKTRKLLDGPLTVGTPTYGKGVQKTLRGVKPLDIKDEVTPISSLGAKGEKDPMGALVSFHKQVEKGAELSGVRQKLLPQLKSVKKSSITKEALLENFPALHKVLTDMRSTRKSIGMADLPSRITGDDILSLLANDRIGAAVRGESKAAAVAQKNIDGMHGLSKNRYKQAYGAGTSASKRDISRAEPKGIDAYLDAYAGAKGANGELTPAAHAWLDGWTNGLDETAESFAARAAADSAEEAAASAGKSELDRFTELMGVSRDSAKETLVAADKEARTLLSGMVDRASGRATKGASPLSSAAQKLAWEEKLTTLLTKVQRGAPGVAEEWAGKKARELAKITDPEELGTKIEELASAMHQRAHRVPKDFFEYLVKTPPAQVADRVEASALRQLADALGLPTKGNTMTIIKSLRESGYVAYREAKAAEAAASTVFGGQTLTGSQEITDGLKALASEEGGVQALRTGTAAKSAASMATLSPAEADAVVGSLSGMLNRNLLGFGGDGMKTTKGGEFFTKALETLDDGTKVPRTIVQRVEDRAQYQMWNGIVNHASKEAERLGISTAARPGFMMEKVTRMLRAGEDYLRASGMVPTSRMTDAEKLFRGGANKHRNEVAFLSIADVLEELPPELQKLMFFNSGNKTLPVTLLQNIGRWAIRRHIAPTDEMAQKVAVARNAYAQRLIQQTTKSFWKNDPKKAAKFAAALDDVMRDPQVVANLTRKHVENAILAKGVWGDTAAAASMKIRGAFAKAMASPHLPKGAKIKAVLNYTKGIEKALDRADITEPLAREMALWDASIVMGQMVDADLFYTVRSAGRAEKANVTNAGKVLTDQQAADLAFGIGVKSIEEAPKKAAKAAKADKPITPVMVDDVRTITAREGEGSNGKAFLKDTEMDIQDVVGSGVQAQLKEMPDLVDDVNTQAMRFDTQMTAGFSNKFVQGFFTKFKRGYGMDAATHLKTNAEFSHGAQTARFNAGLKQLRSLYEATPGTLKSAFRLLQDADIPVKLPDGEVVAGQAILANYFDMASGFAEGAATRVELDAAKEELDIALRQAGGAEVGDDVLKAASDLWPFVGEVFDSADSGLFARAGNNGDDINAILRSMQTRDADGKPLEMYGGFEFTRNGAPSDLVHAWRGIGRGGEDIDPVEILRSTHAALQHATIAPTIAASFSREFGHEAFGHTFEEARKLGWQKPPTREVGKPFLKYLDPDQLFDPEMLSELKYMDDTLQAVRALPEGGVLEKMFKHVDPIVQAVKSSITIWRPGHWGTNIMGEAWMNAFAGVTNPAHYNTAMKILAKNHKIADFDATLIDDYLSKNAPAGVTPRAVKDGEDTIEIMINGKLQRVPSDLVYRGAEARGVILHHSQADDVAIDPAANSAKIAGAKPFQTVRNVNRVLGRGSVARDSVFRLTHAIDRLKKGSFRSLEEALDSAAADVHKWHPSYQTLTPFDQVYTRRFIYFYTWQRQAIARMFEGSLNMPSLMALPSKLQYGIAYGNGVDPESYGAPVSTNEALPDYLEHSAYGSPLNIGGELFGMSTNAPTLDIFTQLFGKADYDPTLSPGDNIATSGGAALRQNVGQMLTPALSVPMSILQDRKVRGDAYTAEDGLQGRLENIIDQTGATYPDKILFGNLRTDAEDDPAEQQQKQLLALINSMTGLKLTQQTNADSQSTAERDQRDRIARWVKQNQEQTANQ